MSKEKPPMKRRDKITIYNFRSAPFRIGGTHEAIKTEIYEPTISLEAETKDGLKVGFWVIPREDLNYTFCVSRDCGAIVGGATDTGRAIAGVIDDITSAKSEVIEKQIEQGTHDCKSAIDLTEEDFWHNHRDIAKNA